MGHSMLVDEDSTTEATNLQRRQSTNDYDISFFVVVVRKDTDCQNKVVASQFTHGRDAGRSVRVGRWRGNRSRRSQRERPDAVAVATRVHAVIGMLLLLTLLAGGPAESRLAPLVSRQGWSWCRRGGATCTRRIRRSRSLHNHTNKHTRRAKFKPETREKEKKKKKINFKVITSTFDKNKNVSRNKKQKNSKHCLFFIAPKPR